MTCETCKFHKEGRYCARYPIWHDEITPDHWCGEHRKPVKRKTVNKEDSKIKYAENILLKKKEYETLCKDSPEPAVGKMIEVLDLYKGSNGKKYKSDYMAILNWVKTKVEKDYPQLFYTIKETVYKELTEEEQAESEIERKKFYSKGFRMKGME
jgi:hypothetical protein